MHRCNSTASFHKAAHETYCVPHIAELEALDRLGFDQETYAERRTSYTVWNRGVLNHRWLLTDALPCALCHEPALAVTVEDQTMCLRCLNEYPRVAWHPTGAIRPTVQSFLLHATTCEKHSTPSNKP